MEPEVLYNAAAVLLWLPPGEAPGHSSFDFTQPKPPPDPNPEAFWQFSEAVRRAMSAMAQNQNGDKMPWIKVGIILYDLDGIRVAHRPLRQRQEKAET